MIFSFDNNPVLFFALGNLLLILAGGISVYSFLNQDLFQNKKVVFFTLLFFCVLLLILRFPIIIYNQAFNPDENMFIVGAMTLAEGYYYWETVDGGSSGPFNFYIIILFCELFHQPYDYISTRIISICLLIGSIFFYFYLIRESFSTSIAVLSIFPVVAYFANVKHHDFLHFSSERLPIFLMSIMTYLYIKISKTPQIKVSTTLLFGCVSGIVLFTKVQVIPIAFAISVSMLWLLYKRTNKIFSKYTLWLIIGSMIVPAILGLIAWRLNFIDKALKYYLRNHILYGGGNNIWEGFYNSIFDEANVFLRIIMVLSFFLILYHVLYRRPLKPTKLSVFIILFLVSTLFAVYKTGFIFQHYLLLLVFPSVLLYATFLNDLFTISRKKIIVTLLTTFTILILSNTLVYPFVNHYVTSGTTQRPLPISETGKQILKYIKPKEKLVIWGDDGRLYLETQLMQGIRWSNSHWGMYSSQTQNEYQNEYAKEFKNGKFPIFVDTHASNAAFMPRKQCGFETLPAIKKIIDEEYQFIGEFDDKNRIFIRKDRLSE